MLYEALDVPRDTYYNYILRNKRTHTWYAKRREEYQLKIQQIHDDSHQIFGATKICAVMKEEYRISIKMVRELMQKMGLPSIRQDAKSNYDQERRGYKNYLNQQFSLTRPNEYWGSDVTYFRYNEKSYYICAVLDLFSRMVVGYKVGKSNKHTTCKKHISNGIRKPTIGFTTDFSYRPWGKLSFTNFLYLSQIAECYTSIFESTYSV